MIKDLHFNFKGFSGSEGHCHIRIAQKTSKGKMVIVCSQYKNYYGISPTNAVEFIAEQLFYDIANKEIKGITLPTLPIYEKWHDDITLLDRLLVKINPRKYKWRFKHEYLDITEIFNQIIWIERYPGGTGFWDDVDDLSLVSMGRAMDPNWHGRPSERFIKKQTGFDFSELFADPDVIDLKEVQKNFEEISDARNIISNHINRPVRWTRDLLKQLPYLISNAKFVSGRENEEDLWELQIQALIEQIFNLSFPESGLFESEFKVSKLLGIHKAGSEKKCDLVVFEPESNTPQIMIELKRACNHVSEQPKKIMQDIAKLLIYSKVFKVDSYLLICGQKGELNKAVNELDNVLSHRNSYSGNNSIDKSCSIDDLDLTDEYHRLLTTFSAHNLHTRLVGISDDRSVMLWQISHLTQNLTSNKPYFYRLMNPSNSDTKNR